MLVITRVEWMETERDPEEIMHNMRQHEHIQLLTHDGEDYVEASAFVELCHGRRFVHPARNIDVVLACDEKSANLLGLQFECWQKMEKQSEIYRKQADLLTDKLDDINKMGIWQRIKFVFTKSNF